MLLSVMKIVNRRNKLKLFLFKHVQVNYYLDNVHYTPKGGECISIYLVHPTLQARVRPSENLVYRIAPCQQTCIVVHVGILLRLHSVMV